MSFPQPAIKYVAGGTVQAGDGVYVERAADKALLSLCRASEFAYVLTSRQMGKSSLMIRTAEKLIEDGIKPVIIDLSELGAGTTAEQWYRGFLEYICEQLDLRDRLGRWWDSNQHLSIVQRFNSFISDIVLTEIREQVVVFVDEIDTTLRLDFTDDFFASIRSLYVARARHKALTRISFVLLGVASPSDLIKDIERTPFNIGRRIDLQDFTEQDAVRDLHAEPELVKSVFRYTGGHPYLTLRVFRSLSEQPLLSDLEERIQELFLGDQAGKDSNLQFVRDMLTKRAPDREATLVRYRQVHQGKRVPDLETDTVCTWLRLSGIVGSVSGLLRVRNLIYQRVFNRTWIQRNRRINWARRAAWGGGVAGALLIFVAAVLAPVAYLQRKAAEVARDEAVQRRAEAERARVKAEIATLDAERARSDAETERQIANRLKTNAEHERTIAEKLEAIVLSERFAIKAGSLQGERQIDLEPAGLLSTESMERFPGFKADQALRESMKLLPHQIASFTHQDAVLAVTFSPDGRYVATGSRDNTARVFEVSSGREVAQFKHPDMVLAVAFSPDSRYVATGSGNNTVQVFEASSGKEVSHLTHRGRVLAVTFSPDGRYVAMGSWDNTKRVFDTWVFEMSSGKEAWHFSDAIFEEPVFAELPEQEKKFTDYTDPTLSAPIFSLAFSPDGRYLATGGSERIAWVFEASSGKAVSHLTHDSRVLALTFTPDGRYVATGSADDTVRLFEVNSGKEIRRLTYPGTVSAVAFSPDGRYMAIGSWDKTVRVFENGSGKEISRLTHRDRVFAVAFSPDGRYVATASRDKTSRIFEMSSGKELPRFVQQAPIEAVAFSPDGRYVTTGSADNTARIFDVDSGKEVSRLTHRDRVFAMTFSPDGRYVATASWDNTAGVFEVRSGKEVSRLIHRDRVFTVAFSPDGRYVATGCLDNTAQVFEVATGKEISRFVQQAPIEAVAFSPDGRYVTTGSADNTARVFDVDSGKEISRFVQQAPIEAVAFSPDGLHVVTGSADNTARVFDVNSGKEIWQVKHDSPVKVVVFSPNGRYVTTGSVDNIARVFDAASGEAVSELTLADRLRTVRYISGGRYLIAASGALANEITVTKHLLYPQDLIADACSRLTRNLTSDEWREYVGTEIPYHKTCNSQ